MIKTKTRKPKPIPMAYPSGTLISLKVVAEEILHCTYKTVYEMVEDGRLPAYRFTDKPGSAIRVQVDDVYAMLQPLIPEAVMADMRSRQPSPLHVPMSESGVQ